MVYNETRFSVARFNADSAPQPDGLRCVSLFIPDDDFYLNLLAGLYGLATRATNWEGEQENRDACALLMNVAYTASGFEECMNCDVVAECIANDENTQNAIAEAINENLLIQQAIANNYNPLSGGSNPPSSVTGAPLAPAPEDCDLDTLFGQVVSLIDNMNTNNVDSQEIIESITNVAERISHLLAAIPGLGILPLDEIVNYIQSIWTDDLFEAYAANDTTEYRDTLKCELFCIAQNNDCTLTLDLLYEYFLNRLAATPADTLSDIIVYMASGTWTGTEVNDLFYAAQILFMKYGNQFFSMIGLKPFGIYMALGEPDDDWILLCEECEWEVIYDFTIDEQGVTTLPGAPTATYDAGVGWRRGASPTNVGRISLYWDFGYDVNINSVRLLYNGLSSSGGNLQTCSIYKAPAYTLVEGQPFGDDRLFETPFTSDIMALDTASDTDGTLYPIDGYLYRVVLRGTGTPPPSP